MLAFDAVVWAAYRLRVQQVARALNARFDERLVERTRMARDLHDTLLQTLQGTKMVADTALDRPDDAPALVRALKQVSTWIGQASEEGRSAVNALRTSTTEANDLAEAFRRAIEDGRRQSAISASIAVTGSVREMHPVVRDEVYRIGYEAIRNAYTHSRATHLEIALSYGRDLILRVADDGDRDGAANSRARKGRPLRSARNARTRIPNRRLVIRDQHSWGGNGGCRDCARSRHLPQGADPAREKALVETLRDCRHGVIRSDRVVAGCG